jgi:RNA polymerase sigma-70 factor, ECF subfamily
MSQNNPASLAIEDLVRCYYAAVTRLALSILDDGCAPDAAAESEDAAQETFIAAARSLADYRGSASPKTWLFAIAINVCRTRLRRRKARAVLVQTVGGLARLFSGAETPEQRVERTERDRELWSAVDALDEKHRLVILLRYVHDLSAGEIAQVLDTNEGTVHSRLHYARQQLAQVLKRSAVFQEAVTP